MNLGGSVEGCLAACWSIMSAGHLRPRKSIPDLDKIVEQLAEERKSESRQRLQQLNSPVDRQISAT